MKQYSSTWNEEGFWPYACDRPMPHSSYLSLICIHILPVVVAVCLSVKKPEKDSDFWHRAKSNDVAEV